MENVMKKLILAALLAAAVPSFAADNSRIGRLEAEIAALKQRIAVLEQKGGQMLAPQAVQPVAAVPAVAPVRETRPAAVPAAEDFSRSDRVEQQSAPSFKQENVLYECGIYVNGRTYEMRDRNKEAAKEAAQRMCLEEQDNRSSCSKVNIVCTKL